MWVGGRYLVTLSVFGFIVIPDLKDWKQNAGLAAAKR